MPNKIEFIELSETRYKEVKTLYNNELYDGARYLSGYIIETALKARICKILDSDYPDSGEISRVFLTHKFDNLVKLGGLKRSLDLELNTNVGFKSNWPLITSWSESFRYNSIGTSSAADMENLFLALEDKNDGILNWIKRKW